MMDLPSPLAHRQRGTTLLEALITILVLAVAALAYAGLQLRSVSGSATALWRSQANVLASEMADRIRANPVGLAAGQYNSLQSTGTESSCSSASPCTAAQMAATDFVRWRARLQTVLPGGSGVVCLDSSADDGTIAAPACSGTGSQLVIKVFWSERGAESRVVTVLRS